MKTYIYHEEGGHSQTMPVSDMGEAVAMARTLAQEGDWGTEGAAVDVWITEEDEDGEVLGRRDITVMVEPDHDALIRHATRYYQERSCGDSPDNHDWTREGEGGCDSNPGVWATGGTSFMFADHCRVCGLHRREHVCGSQRNPGEHDKVEYTMPDAWCAECEREECQCERE